jgi:guanine nucleotide-binding protein G(i) subunit alpha
MANIPHVVTAETTVHELPEDEGELPIVQNFVDADDLESNDEQPLLNDGTNRSSIEGMDDAKINPLDDSSEFDNPEAFPPDDADNSQANAENEQLLPPPVTKRRIPVKVLLLGSLESGKSTLFRQIGVALGADFASEEARMRWFHVIHRNILEAMGMFIHQVEKMGLALQEETEVSAAVVRATTEDPPFLTLELAEHLERLWKDPAIQKAVRNSNNYYVIESTPYYLNKIRDLVGPTYIPSWEDVTWARVRTTGIIQQQFNVDDDWQVSITDVGGARNERKKWIHTFENVDVVIYLAPLADYDRVMFEDEQTNRMDESIRLFEELVNSKWFKNTAFVLWLTKQDQFAEKMKVSPVSDYFPDFEGGKEDVEAAIEFFKNEHIQQCWVYDRKIHSRALSAVDIQSVAFAMEETMQFVFQHLLERARKGTLNPEQIPEDVDNLK